jgi:hypothetical protein
MAEDRNSDSISSLWDEIHAWTDPVTTALVSRALHKDASRADDSNNAIAWPFGPNVKAGPDVTPSCLFRLRGQPMAT